MGQRSVEMNLSKSPSTRLATVIGPINAPTCSVARWSVGKNDTALCDTTMTKMPPSTLMVLTILSAAQGVLRPLCLLLGLAAHQHVGRTCGFIEIHVPR